jgi:hypothetical protein
VKLWKAAQIKRLLEGKVGADHDRFDRLLNLIDIPFGCDIPYETTMEDYNLTNFMNLTEPSTVIQL